MSLGFQLTYWIESEVEYILIATLIETTSGYLYISFLEAVKCSILDSIELNETLTLCNFNSFTLA